MCNTNEYVIKTLYIGISGLNLIHDITIHRNVNFADDKFMNSDENHVFAT